MSVYFGYGNILETETVTITSGAWPFLLAGIELDVRDLALGNRDPDSPSEEKPKIRKPGMPVCAIVAAPAYTSLKIRELKEKQARGAEKIAEAVMVNARQETVRLPGRIASFSHFLS